MLSFILKDYVLHFIRQSTRPAPRPSSYDFQQRFEVFLFLFCRTAQIGDLPASLLKLNNRSLILYKLSIYDKI